MNEIYKNYVENIKDLNSLITVINNYFQGILKKEKYMSCPFHNDKSPSFYITDKGQGAFYKCFSCGESGDILSFIQKIENLNFIDSLKKAYEILQIPIELPKIKNNEINRVNKNKSVQYYNEQSQKSINENNIDKAFELSCKAENENEKSYFVNLPYLDSKGRPLKIWENLNEILKFNNIKVQYNEVSKITEIKGVDSTEFNNQIMDIHSLSIKCGLNLNLSLLLNFINRIGEENCVNPVCDYLDNCYKNFDNEKVYIQKLCDAIIIDNEFDKTIKRNVNNKMAYKYC